jgi:hypothetical protein
MNYTLKNLLEHPELIVDNERLRKQIEEVKKDKVRLNNITEIYNTRHQKEIDEGTIKRRILIEDGKRRGLKEEEVLQEYGKFLPSRITPILNFLYFFMMDEDVDKQSEREEMNNQYGLLNEEYTTEDKGHGNSNPPDMMNEFIYDNMSYDMFKKIKKLKALSQSANENEAFQAYRKCMALCKEYDLDFNKIPSK